MLVFINDHYMPCTSHLVSSHTDPEKGTIGALDLDCFEGRVHLEVKPDSELSEAMFFESLCEGMKM